ncbi:hypothetical protein DFQ28_004604, partial [Apophysomyces sp. BC1034]
TQADLSPKQVAAVRPDAEAKGSDEGGALRVSPVSEKQASGDTSPKDPLGGAEVAMNQEVYVRAWDWESEDVAPEQHETDGTDRLIPKRKLWLLRRGGQASGKVEEKRIETARVKNATGGVTKRRVELRGHLSKEQEEATEEAAKKADVSLLLGQTQDLCKEQQEAIKKAVVVISSKKKQKEKSETLRRREKVKF